MEGVLSPPPTSPSSSSSSSFPTRFPDTCSLLEHIKSNYESSHKVLQKVIPHYCDDAPPPTKKRKTLSSSSLTIFNSYIYSFIGSRVYHKMSKILCGNIVNAIMDENSNTSVQLAIAIFQLSQDATIVNSDPYSRTKPKIGLWVDQLIDDKEEQGIVIPTKLKMQRGLENLCQEFLKLLLSNICVNNSDDDDFVTLLNSYMNMKFSPPEVGVLLLYTLIDAKYDLVYLLSSKVWNDNSYSVVGRAVSQIFVPIANSSWPRKRCEQVFDKLSVNFLDPESVDIDTRSNYILIPITDAMMLKEWAISCMLANAYKFIMRKMKNIHNTNDVQLVIDGRSDHVCLQIWNGQNLQDIDAFSKEPQAYLFVTAHLAMYLRMLLFINPKYKLSQALHRFGRLYFMHTASDNNMFFYAHMPMLSDYDDIECLEKHRVYGIINFVSKFIINQGWHMRNVSTNHLKPLFKMNHFINDKKVIIYGAMFISRILNTPMSDYRRKFMDFPFTAEHMESIFMSYYNLTKVFYKQQ